MRRSSTASGRRSVPRLPPPGRAYSGTAAPDVNVKDTAADAVPSLRVDTSETIQPRARWVDDFHETTFFEADMPIGTKAGVAVWDETGSGDPSITFSYIEPFDARVLRRTYARVDHLGRQIFNLDVWKSRDGRLLVRLWSRSRDVDTCSLEIHGFSAADRTWQAPCRMNEQWVPHCLREEYDLLILSNMATCVWTDLRKHPPAGDPLTECIRRLGRGRMRSNALPTPRPSPCGRSGCKTSTRRSPALQCRRTS